MMKKIKIPTDKELERIAIDSHYSDSGSVYVTAFIVSLLFVAILFL